MAATEASTSLRSMLDGFSLEMTHKDIAGLAEAADLIPQGTRINVTHLAHETLDMRLETVQAALARGFVPVTHIAARRLADNEELGELLGLLQQLGAADNVFLIAGDPPEPLGPFECSADVIRTGQLARHGVRVAGVAGHPEGHPAQPYSVMAGALREKLALLRDQGIEPAVTTQICFDPELIVRWLDDLRANGDEAPVRIGVSGPAASKRLLGYSGRFGIGVSPDVIAAYGFDPDEESGTVTPDRLIARLDGLLADRQENTVRAHFFAFSGLPQTTRWITEAATR